MLLAEKEPYLPRDIVLQKVRRARVNGRVLSSQSLQTYVLGTILSTLIESLGRRSATYSCGFTIECIRGLGGLCIQPASTPVLSKLVASASNIFECWRSSYGNLGSRSRTTGNKFRRNLSLILVPASSNPSTAPATGLVRLPSHQYTTFLTCLSMTDEEMDRPSLHCGADYQGTWYKCRLITFQDKDVTGSGEY